MTYRFRPFPELYWGVIVSAALVLLQGLVTLDPEAVTSWQTWAIALGGGMVRAASGAAISYLTRSLRSEPSLVEQIVNLPPAERLALIAELERLSSQGAR